MSIRTEQTQHPVISRVAKSDTQETVDVTEPGTRLGVNMHRPVFHPQRYAGRRITKERFEAISKPLQA